MLRTVRDLLATIEQLPEPERDAARARVDAALEGDARSCRVALGVLALDLADPAFAATSAPRPAAIDRAPAPVRDLQVRVHVVDLDHLPAAASA